MTRAQIPPINLAARIPYWLLGLGFFLLALLLRLACFTGLIASDDLYYSNSAQLIAQGQYVPASTQWDIRYGLLLPVSLMYRLIGVNEWTTIIVPLIASSLAVGLLAIIGTRMFGLGAGLIAALLFATFPMQLRYASVLVPEPVLACYILAALLIYIRTENRAPMAFGVLTGAVLGIAYLTKEPGLFIVPALLIDALLRRRWRNAFGITIGSMAIVVLEHTYYLLVTGDMLFRYHALALHNSTTRPAVNLDLVRRLFKDFPRKMLFPNEDFGLHSIVALALSAGAFLRFRNDRRSRLLMLWASVPWLYLNFGTSSFARYTLIPPAARYIDLTYPPLFLFSGWLLDDLMSKVAWTRLLIMLATAVLLLSGVATGLWTKGAGYETNDIAVLRVIADSIEKGGAGRACVETENRGPIRGFLERGSARWQPALFILSGGDLRECEGGPARVTLGADTFGLPYVAAREP